MTDVVSMIPTPDQQNTTSQTEQVTSQSQNSQTQAMDQTTVQSQTEGIASQNQNIQTEAMAVDVAQSQTDNINSQHQQQQTDKVQQHDHIMQAAVDTQNTEMQTLPKVEHQKSQQTEVKTYTAVNSQTDAANLTHTTSQTEFVVKIVPECVEQNLQAGSWNPQDSVVQTDQSMYLMVEGGCQVAPEIVIGECQTDNPVTYTQDTQTILDTAECSSQAVVEVQESVCQATVDDSTVQAQTDLSMFNLVDGEAQAVVEVAYGEVQATPECYMQQVQTDSSMALLVDNNVQATVEVVENVMQTDSPQLTEQHMQTELEVDQKFIQTDNETCEMNIQAVVEMVTMDTQTEVQEVSVLEPPALLQIEAEVPGMEMANEMPLEVSVPDIAAAEVSISSDTQPIINSQSSVGSINMDSVVHIEPRQVSEEGCQTDPVTIIIGDASFLVKKLKSSALSPTKVSSMGNEIEIELRAEDEESYAGANDIGQRVQAPMRGSPASMRARGVRTRGGPGGYRGSARPPRAPPRYYSNPADIVGKYSCPICSDTFHESPALYEHLQRVHAEAFSLIKKPRGREGKTIIKRQPQDAHGGPPILTPMEPDMQETMLLQQQALQQQHSLEQQQRELEQQALQQQALEQHVLEQQALQQQELEEQQRQLEQQQLQQEHMEGEEEVLEQEQPELEQQLEVGHLEHVELTEDTEEVQEETQIVSVITTESGETEIIVTEPSDVGLFEDSNWTPNKTRKRNLARRQITDDDAVVEADPDQQYQIVIQPEEEPEEEPEIPELHEELTTKRKRVSTEDGLRKRVRSEEEEELEDANDDTPRRRSTRANIKVEKDDTPAPKIKATPKATPKQVTTPKVDTPTPGKRGRGRPKKAT